MKPADLTALQELESRICALEKRLKNANATRDSYLDFLRTKYPSWNPSISRYIRNRVEKEYIVNRLATSDYHWDWSTNDNVYMPQKIQNMEKNPPLYFDIPNSGPLLNADMQRTRQRLAEISEQLKFMRNTRLSLPSNDYIRNRMLTNEAYATLNSDDNDDFLSNARKRLADMTVTLFEPIASPTHEQIGELKMKEQRDTLVTESNTTEGSNARMEDQQDIIKQEHIPSESEDVPQKGVPDQPISNKAPMAVRNSYATVLNLLKNKSMSSESDDDIAPTSTVHLSQQIALKETTVPSNASILLNQYLRPNANRKGSSSSDDVIVKQIPDDSDSDFFN
uniref:Coiled-coil domain-containing protein n=1 Tax=Heterorhabditis bacteriophora TaxID=37862 RepID=A0A1I7XMP3_HETBA